ncbi:DUF2269 domain-containing protein [Corynebacterium sp. 153RC1]|uniref:DUF2269 domain-containing protein n=1 Tax=unclassified Corynebacterium TaxID=2624378 RepID=UPI00211C1712|nr:DUF2269 domain-containing protein [Corynebacterium sp. 209RC1]MCQ9353750.1 DUF2269 domain-containing protein [Corynebacterium sp. 1222RC1]MCQ9356266.1 DUF2269 domain-containing protein [Corynebacterium sp. 122RC1]MCQ9358368.1 DUF2269 domain-containing protein [Corynebacterium sp. 142RC1]MCQ9360897.1 DUF2269 domain-containing protein [Corynebacterium sp. 153RC1]MCQ9362831.1 DUF2269 domain-containing protein [Corynebacterium sp. 732RC1]MCQ9364917.1 DUF2269 domain-containing protein [Coryneba
MGTLLILLHVIAAILFLGPVTVAVSTFHARAYEASQGSEQAKGAARNLLKITRTYGTLSLLVPLIGFGVMFTGDYWSDGKFHASIALSVIAWALLLFVILPRQQKLAGALGILEADEQEAKAYTVDNWDKEKSQLSMFGGIFSLLWVIVAILMLL